MSEFTWSNEMGHRGRAAWLLLVDRDGLVHAFSGESIPTVCVVRNRDFSKCGKWSHTTYLLQLASGVRALAGRDGWETGRFDEGLACVAQVPVIDTWAACANALGVTVQEAKRFLREWRPKAAERLDSIEAELVALEESDESAGGDGVEKITISFGSPTRKQREAGFWTAPKWVAPGVWATLVDPQRDWEADNVAICGCVEGKVIDAVHMRGFGGGSRSLTIAMRRRDDLQGYLEAIAQVPGGDVVAAAKEVPDDRLEWWLQAREREALQGERAPAAWHEHRMTALELLKADAEGRRVAREDRLRALGFEEPTAEQRKENLALNIALREWPKD